MINKLGGRKNVFALLVFVVATALVVGTKISSDQWVDIIKWLAATFVIGNAVEHATGMKQ